MTSRKISVAETVMLQIGRAKKVLVFGGTQLVAQLVSLVVGLLVVRLLSVDEYAVYALFGALLGAAATSTDLSSSGALITLLSHAEHRSERAQITESVAKFRAGLIVISLLLFVPLLICLSADFGPQALVLCAVFAAIIVFQSMAVLDKARLASAGSLEVINRAEPFAAFVRLGLLLPLFLFGGGAVSALWPSFAWLLSALILWFWLRSKSEPVVNWPPQTPSPSLFRIISPMLPAQVFFMFKGLLPIMSLAAFTVASDVAEFWALGRLGAVFAFATPMLTFVAHPYVSRGRARGFAKRSILIVSTTLLLTTLLVLSGFLMPTVWLLLLGDQYAHLGDYVWASLLSGSIVLISATFSKMAVASGETSLQYLSIIAGLAAQISVIWVNPITDLKSAYVFMILSGVVQVLVQLLLYVRSVRIVNSSRASQSL